MHQVYVIFPIRQLTGELTLTHYVALSAVKEKKERMAYLKKAEKGKCKPHGNTRGCGGNVLNRE